MPGRAERPLGQSVLLWRLMWTYAYPNGHVISALDAASPLTALSQTAEPAPDLSVLTGYEMDPDQLGWTPADSPDARHETTEQKGTQRQGGAAAPDPAAYGLVGPAVSPPDVLRGRGRIFPAPARGEPRTPS
jgi:hypothetical protein